MHCKNSYAINICCVGIEAGATAFAHTPHKLFEKSPLHRFLYPVIYLLGAVRHFFNKDLMEQHYNIMLDGKDVSGSYNSISMGNGQYYGGGKRPYPYAVQTDGKLDLVLIKNITILNSVKSMLRFLTGNFEKEPDKFLYHRAENIAITSDASLYITLDCETFFDSGMNIEMHKQAIDFVVPKGVSYMNATE
jgi:diacylglycerol kinase family enzyme